MAWFHKMQYTVIKKPVGGDEPAPAEGGLWSSCPGCKELILNEDLEKNMFLCGKCEHHFRLPAPERVQMLSDESSFRPMFMDVRSNDPLKFPGYEKKLKSEAGAADAVITGTARLGGVEIALGVMDFSFMGGSMGIVVGERLTRLFELAVQRTLPVIVVSASGGARMHEGILSLMQMAKTSAAIGRYRERCRRPYISILADPTTGGTTASFAMLGDVHISEPGTLIGFAGPRVIEQTIRQKLPPGFQRAEFLLEHGFLDMVVHRKQLRATVAKLVQWL